jgi:hypothetical protein
MHVSVDGTPAWMERRIEVAVLALDLQLSGVQFVRVVDGLLENVSTNRSVRHLLVGGIAARVGDRSQAKRLDYVFERGDDGRQKEVPSLWERFLAC